MRELVSETAKKFNIPITSMQVMHADGSWRFPKEILTQDSFDKARSAWTSFYKAGTCPFVAIGEGAAWRIDSAGEQKIGNGNIWRVNC